MTGSTPRNPGHLLHRLARLVFDPAVLADVVEPTIADFQSELRDAAGLRQRALARWRGYLAFWILVAISPLAFHGWIGRRTASLLPGICSAVGVWLLLAFGLTFIWPSLGNWTLTAVGGGSLFALVLHAWNERHPLASPTLEVDEVGRPEINLSKIPVSGNAGGLIFAAGSIAILVIGLPAWRWYFLTTLGGGVLVAWLLTLWRLHHPGGRAGAPLGVR